MGKSMNYLRRCLLIFAIALFIGQTVLPNISFAYTNNDFGIIELEEDLDILAPGEEHARFINFPSTFI